MEFQKQQAMSNKNQKKHHLWAIPNLNIESYNKGTYWTMNIKNSINIAYITSGYFQNVSLTTSNWSLMKSSSHFIVSWDTKLCNYVDACVWQLMWSWAYKLINCLSILARLKRHSYSESCLTILSLIVS